MGDLGVANEVRLTQGAADSGRRMPKMCPCIDCLEIAAWFLTHDVGHPAFIARSASYFLRLLKKH